VVATTFSGSITSAVAVLAVDATFTKVTDSLLVMDPGTSRAPAWGDYDNDGFPDLFLARAGTDFNSLYHNDGDGTFSRITTGNVVTDYVTTSVGSWADYDNDGWLDLLVVNTGPGRLSGIGDTNVLYHNEGDGTFSKANAGALGSEAALSVTSAWADYNRDGYLDVIIGTSLNPNLFYRNDGNGTFSKVTVGPGADTGLKIALSVAWADFDRDLDLVQANASNGTAIPGHDYLFRNDGDGNFTRVTSGPVVTSGGNSFSCAWVDYDNDQDEDLFVVNYGENNSLYRNNGNGTFTAITDNVLVNEGGEGTIATVCAWGDFDNDGWIDAFIANDVGQNNSLYRNNGDGSFTSVHGGSPVNDGGNSVSCTWVDYNRDGFLDLFVVNAGENNLLYRNNGNSNAWLNIQLAGRASNISGVGARVHALATINGAPRWQMRQVAARDGTGSPNTLDTQFGFGNATNVDLLRIEWPSGVAQVVSNVAVRQFLTIRESPSFVLGQAVVREGDTTITTMLFPVTITDPTNAMVAVSYYTMAAGISNRVATAGADYIPTNGTLTFNAGETLKHIEVQIVGDVQDEVDETFTMVLTNATIIPIGIPRAIGTIVDDDPLTMAVNDFSIVEGDVGHTNAAIMVNLNKAVGFPVSVTYATVSGSALAGLDYISSSGSLLFEPGEYSKEILVPIIGDLINEVDETFVVTLNNFTNGVFADRQAIGKIIENDPLPIITVNDVAVREYNAGTNHAVFTMALSGASSRTITVNYATSNNTAAAGADYVARSGAVAFLPGVLTQALVIVVNGDLILESDETFFIQFLQANNALLAGTRAIGTILDDDFRVLAAVTKESAFRLQFPTVSGRRYRIEWSATLSSTPSWLPLSGFDNVLGTGGLVEAVDMAEQSARFYRIVLAPE
jgi:hypothetical protein